MRELAQRAIDICREIATFSDDQDGTTRLYLLPATRQVHGLIGERMERLGMKVWLDAAGNLRGVYPGLEAAAPRLLMGLQY